MASRFKGSDRRRPRKGRCFGTGTNDTGARSNRRVPKILNRLTAEFAGERATGGPQPNTASEWAKAQKAPGKRKHSAQDER